VEEVEEEEEEEGRSGVKTYKWSDEEETPGEEIRGGGQR
jgi:hypothetical protein